MRLQTESTIFKVVIVTLILLPLSVLSIVYLMKPIQEYVIVVRTSDADYNVKEAHYTDGVLHFEDHNGTIVELPVKSNRSIIFRVPIK